MIAIPAVDLRGGQCVQLVGGDYEQEQVRLADPLSVARDWSRTGFTRMHIVDLDAATGRGQNHELIRDLLRDSMVPVQVGGGVRDESRIERLIDDGAEWVVVGTRAVEDEDWREEMANRFPGRLIVAADVRERRVVTRGWAETSRLDVIDFVESLRTLPLAGVLVTAVHLEGLMQGTDLPLMEDVAEASAWPVYASGGVTSLEDMRALEHRGLAGAVLGMALYTGVLDARRLAEEYGA
ncbi:MAG TPA: 1-(5-phosphoribosyl)-5-[(5-phosphoribosylamino)methylideneamino]imidazole-4-carboxamide isomerase [Gemmatimonas aurantiaca]|uniref:1-(5-phosphoribosyl)-5-[(5-phosphoribosylamino)methylideneamino] imidazole-4-carboxamide isomerase n=2 Tax=Gemmatimonas aurantiaca TaxID=173480 RepID=HIS4_GEMAT|nr:1-(5-phosphoribosyl)-5-[(5-phosphoribosylamino)methylideneamino]imidazole-4-carboxamide isomerase [Gemmatimonas aurantiaca]C1A4L9.1 RecName: Full=1-(5-phosphoribosyl)-5-[(5-phosphoribosylamino)methylideneamino] imidazole-4-carboxamide isomerase; AltName: Full=Phosphoribosylformimino-5-aminoimidazole carboxamide ribotide isomerase [Gemmatimonas aurantiaca T-27]BAH37179.1 1-(5-phosphoribosyl)-5-[(5-phosphoribosylamino) methylideneamino] imidazole-4-carboxamide isomerase [Gemmatimonas aurantiaca 